MIDIYKALNPKKFTIKDIPRKYLITIASGIGVLLLIIVYFGIFYTPKLEFETTTATRGDIKSSISASGSLSPTNEVEIGSVISGIVLEVLVEENDRVSKGQILARINPETINQQIARYQAQLNSAQAQLRASQQTLIDKKWNYDRLQELYDSTKGRSPSLLELQNAKTNYTSALSDVDIKKASIIEIETNIKSSTIDLKNSQIISPIDGVVLTKSIEVGQSVAASFQAPVLFKVAESLEEMVLKANISEADIGKIKEGQEVSFTVDAYPERRFSAKVDKVNYGSGDGSSSSSSSSTSSSIITYIARIEVENKSLLLRPDMSATADIIIAQSKDTLLVPSAALYFDLNRAIERSVNKNKGSQGSPLSSMFAPPPRPKAGRTEKKQGGNKQGTLWVVVDGKPQAVNVEVGISDGQFSEILSGIDEHTQIITSLKNNK
ncbi:efflux RND transporter periplasmic adaptor subunit [Helicobacter sp. 23-1046]